MQPRRSMPSTRPSATRAACQAARAFGVGLGGFQADWVLRVGVAVALAVSRYQAGPLFPVQPGDRVAGDRAERLVGPGRLGRGSMFAEPAGAVVHGFGEFTQVAVHIGGSSTGDAVSPGARGLGLDAVEHVADTSVQDAGDIAGSCHGAAGHCSLENLAAVEAGGFGFAQRPPQPGAGRVVEGLLGGVSRDLPCEHLERVWRRSG